MAKKNAKKIKKPSTFWLVTEIGRAVAELGISIPYRKFFHNNYQGEIH